MPIELHIEPRRVMDWDQFRQEKLPYSIALDGFVNGPTQRDSSGPYANFDHHSGVDRQSTLSTSGQVYLEINMGLFKTFKDGVPTAHVYVNDPDEDTCLAWWLLKNHEQVTNNAQPTINRLVYCEDKLDSTGGAYPLGDTSIRRKMAWVFQPYNDARFNGRVAEMEEPEMRNVMESVEGRITKHVLGEGEELALEDHYEKIGGGSDWALTKETGPASRMAMYNDEITAFASLVTEKEDSYVYTLGRQSVWIPFHLQELFTELNKVEAYIVTETNRWGGSNTIGGSPRETGSKLSPEKLEKVITLTLNKVYVRESIERNFDNLQREKDFIDEDFFSRYDLVKIAGRISADDIETACDNLVNDGFLESKPITPIDKTHEVYRVKDSLVE